MKTRTIEVDYLARVEGEGAMQIDIAGDKVSKVQLKIFEPPRFFESFLRGRNFTEAPDITARICGICPVAYLMGSCHAMEAISGVTIPSEIRELRRLLYCGEWLKSHVLHMYMLHLPDFLGYDDVVQMAGEYKNVVENGLRLKKIGNLLVEVMAGRDIHPVNIKLGGFYKAPNKQALKDLIPELEWGLKTSLEMCELLAKLDFPSFEQDYEFVALSHPTEYPFNEGELISNKGLKAPISELEKVFVEEHVEHSNALQTNLRNNGECLVGPMARVALNFDKLSEQAKKMAKKLKFDENFNNPFKSIVARAVEVIFCFEEAIRVITKYADSDFTGCGVEVKPQAGTGYGCTEAPRGICYHRYTIDNNGIITDANLIPPTAINQSRIEKDLFHFTQQYINLTDDELRAKCELAIRNYDPCISCSTHFLKLTVNRK